MSNQSEQPVVLVTGGSMGLGYALAKQLLSQGFAVTICGRRKSRLDSAVKTLSTLGPVAGFTGNVSDPYFRRQLVVKTVEQFGRLDGIVNNASTLGDLPMPAVRDTSLSNLRNTCEVNAFAPIGLIQETLPYLEQQCRSLVISISSDAAVGGYPGWGVYGASKAALDLLTKTLAAELSGGVTVYAIDPSDMQTDMHEAASPGDEGLADPNDVAHCLGRLFRPLLDKSDFEFQSGSRLQVSGTELIVKERL